MRAEGPLAILVAETRSHDSVQSVAANVDDKCGANIIKGTALACLVGLVWLQAARLLD